MLAQWLETEGEFIYNRGRTAYKDKAKIARAFVEQGAKLGLLVWGVELRTWFSSLRSRYGRLTNTVSGQASNPPVGIRTGRSGSWNCSPSSALILSGNTGLPTLACPR